jgi:site-specific DNA recombinase
MDRVRDLITSGGVSAVLAQDRDRFSREPTYIYLLKREFEEHGCKMRALNDRGDVCPEGELMDVVFDQFAKFERAKTAERTHRGKLRKAREGKIVADRRPDFGFKCNAARDNYMVDAEQMRLVKRIFYMVGVEGYSIRGSSAPSNARACQRPMASATGPPRSSAAAFPTTFTSRTRTRRSSRWCRPR